MVNWMVSIQLFLFELAFWFFHVRANVTSMVIIRTLQMAVVGVMVYSTWRRYRERQDRRLDAIIETARRHREVQGRELS